MLFESRENVASDEIQDHVEHQRVFVPDLLSDTEGYREGALHLHVHTLLLGEKHCAVVKAANDVQIQVIRHADDDLLDARSGKDELSVLVGILERTEDREGMVLGFFRVVPSLIERLQLRDDCKWSRWDATGLGEPTASCIGISVSPGYRISPQWVGGEDRELRGSFVLARDERTNQMVQSRTNVEQTVPSHDRDHLIDRARNRDAVLELTIGVEHFSHRAWLSTGWIADQFSDGAEMFFCPVQFESPGRLFHDLPLEEDAKQQRQRAEARDPAENALVAVSLKAMAGA